MSEPRSLSADGLKRGATLRWAVGACDATSCSLYGSHVSATSPQQRESDPHTALGGLKYKFGEAMPMANSATSLRRGDEIELRTLSRAAI